MDYESSIVFEPEVCKFFVDILLDKKKFDMDQQKSKIFTQQIKCQILKSFTSLLQKTGKKFLEFLKSQNLLDIMIKELYDQGTKQSKDQPVPVEWAEMKVANIRHAAIEKLISLVPDNAGVSAKIINRNYIQINCTDEKTGTPLIFGFYLRSAINLHMLMENAEF